MRQIPVVVDLIGGLVARPEPSQEDFDVVGRLVAQGSNKQRWALLDAALTVTRTLRDACTEMAGAAGVVFTDDALAFSDDVPADVRNGAYDALRLLAASAGEEPAELVARYRSGQASQESVLGAITMACHCGASVVQAISGFAQTPPRKTWKQIVPFLLEP